MYTDLTGDEVRSSASLPAVWLSAVRRAFHMNQTLPPPPVNG